MNYTKFPTNFFNDPRIVIIEGLGNGGGDKIITALIKFYILFDGMSANAGEMSIKTLCTITRVPEDVAAEAVRLFKAYRLEDLFGRKLPVIDEHKRRDI